MRKFIAILMIITFTTSIFDILDANELCLDNGKQIFSTTNPHADNEYDGLDDNGFQYTTVENFFLPYFPQIYKEKRILQHKISAIRTSHFFYNYIPANNEQPPRV